MSSAMTWDVDVRKSVGSGAQRFELEVAFRSDAQRLVLFGPSGAGKSLTLKAIAGLLRPDAGRVCLGETLLFDSGQDVDVPAEDRALGYVFQEYALFPHLTVRQNVAFSVRKGWLNPARSGSEANVDRWLDALELAPLAKRFPDQLSGGQRQRTALARALVAQPRALLLDEPFAALDLALRRKLRSELFALQAQVKIPTLLITHDEADVAAFADAVVTVEGGKVAAPGSGAADSAFRRDPEGARPMKTSARNRFDGTVSKVTPGAVNDEVELTVAGGRKIVAVVSHESAGSLGLVVGASAFALIKASAIVVVTDLGKARLSARNQLAGQVLRIQIGAVNSEVVISVGGGLEVAAIVTQDSLKSLTLAPGVPAIAIFKASSVIVGVAD